MEQLCVPERFVDRMEDGSDLRIGEPVAPSDLPRNGQRSEAMSQGHRHAGSFSDRNGEVFVLPTTRGVERLDEEITKAFEKHDDRGGVTCERWRQRRGARCDHVAWRCGAADWAAATCALAPANASRSSLTTWRTEASLAGSCARLAANSSRML